MALGPNSLVQFALPPYWDAAYLSKYRLASGETYEQLVADIAQGLAEQNQALLSNPLYAGLISITEELAVEYRVGVASEMTRHTEYSLPDPQRGKTLGHMLPLEPQDYMFSWTWDMLRNARRSQIDADVATGMDAVRNTWQKAILTRLFKSTYTAVGTAGRSHPWADGGTAEAAYVPIARPDRGGTFLYTHNHITFLNGITQANLETAVDNIWEHGYDAPYELLIADADISSWTNTATMTGFTPRADPLIQYGSAVDIARVDDGYIGAIQTDHGVCRVRSCGRIPTLWWSVYKTFGPLDERNPLRVRVGKDGTGAILIKGDHIREFPLENAILFAEFGVGVGEDRTAATAYKNHINAYADPTIA